MIHCFANYLFPKVRTPEDTHYHSDFVTWGFVCPLVHLVRNIHHLVKNIRSPVPRFPVLVKNIDVLVTCWPALVRNFTALVSWWSSLVKQGGKIFNKGAIALSWLFYKWLLTVDCGFRDSWWFFGFLFFWVCICLLLNCYWLRR